MWAEVEDSDIREDVVIEVMGTGNEYKEANRKFIGSVVMPPFVWHVFIKEE